MFFKLVDGYSLLALGADTLQVGALVIDEVVLDRVLVKVLSASVRALL